MAIARRTGLGNRGMSFALLREHFASALAFYLRGFLGENRMTRRHLDSTPAARPAEEPANGGGPQTLRATLWEQICRRLSGGARQLEIEVCHDSATVILAGVVNSCYAKQIIYQLCRRVTPGFRVIDSTVVGRLPPQHD
jgi:hypothetical protein